MRSIFISVFGFCRALQITQKPQKSVINCLLEKKLWITRLKFTHDVIDKSISQSPNTPLVTRQALIAPSNCHVCRGKPLLCAYRTAFCSPRCLNWQGQRFFLHCLLRQGQNTSPAIGIVLCFSVQWIPPMSFHLWTSMRPNPHNSLDSSKEMPASVMSKSLLKTVMWK